MGNRYGHAAAPSFGFDRTEVPVFEAIAAAARKLWPNKTAINLASRAGATHRAAEKWLAGETGISGDHLANLLRSDAGRDVLDALMGDAKPSWWPAFRAELQFADLEKRQSETRQAIEDLRREMDFRRAR